jgi:anti-anti-sigma factor
VPAEQHAAQWLGQTAIVPLPAEIDIANAHAIGDRLLTVLREGPAVLIADMSSTTFCDSSGVRTLVQAYQQAKAASASLRLVVTARGVLRVLAISGADRLMDIYPSVAESVAAPAAAAQDVPARDDEGQPETASP